MNGFFILVLFPIFSKNMYNLVLVNYNSTSVLIKIRLHIINTNNFTKHSVYRVISNIDNILISFFLF